MATSPPTSPAAARERPMSALVRSNRSSSRLSMSSKRGGGSRASDEDGKTAVKVAVRVRPPLKAEDPGYELIPQRFRGATCQVTTPTSLAVESAQGKKLFVFDRVFGEDVDQEGVWEYLQESVNSFVQGYNVSILAYGQSGAGKSYTMGTTGPREQADSHLMGVVPRAAASLFSKLTGSASPRMAGSGLRMPSKRSSMYGLPTLSSLSQEAAENKNWQLKATYVEIYNESLHDLLLEETLPQHERPTVMIREDRGKILLTGLRQVDINSVDDLLNALNFGSSIRQTDATAVNARSSRSHAVFSLNLVQKKSRTTSAQEKRLSMPIEALSSNAESWVTLDSKLHFVDLAGSERLKNTGAVGERAREGISINAGLASLGKVISQLSSRAAGSHVSYRDSKLTRLLQDSLGGNAITYMIACINPAEFHLSETLNTVQYAQRARAIQSKPQIQQSSDDSDKQAVIERLRAEVSFLRDQIRLSERTERKNNAPQERAERQQEREYELQSQLLDIQEHYSNLSQRHAKLISEITKARDSDEETPTLNETVGESAMDRIKRSSSFAAAADQVVLEYEKTIQSLESSLSNTRSTLSSTESALLEKETQLAYKETVAQQLSARLQKHLDREANSEDYLRELEAKVEGVSSGEERNAFIIQDLKKELQRTRDSEISAEEYISTLEERLAEAEQDHEMMQREIDRLEHVVDRQRSIGKLDNLLFELDRTQADQPKSAEPLVNGRSSRESDDFQDAHSVASSARVNGHPEHDEEHDVSEHPTTIGAHEREGPSHTETAVNAEQPQREGQPQVDHVHAAEPVQMHNEGWVSARDLAPEPFDDIPQSPAQSKFVADKLETVTQELFDLRMEHEVTITDYDELQRKYQIALTTLAELQDAVEEARHGDPGSMPTSFLPHAGMNGVKGEDGQPSSSRTLSSELSSLGEPSNATEASDADTAREESFEAEQETMGHDGRLAREVEALKRLHDEKEEKLVELNDEYGRLQEEHQAVLTDLEQARMEAEQARVRPVSPTLHVIRRKSNQVPQSDRAQRACATLRTMASDQFENEPELVRTFDENLDNIMAELNKRSKTIQELDTELAGLRNEMTDKMRLISGLTKERSSMSAISPTQFDSLSDKLMDSENRLRLLQEGHSQREQELLSQIQALKSAPRTASDHTSSRSIDAPSSPMPGVFPETPAPEQTGSRELGDDMQTAHQPNQQLTELQAEVAEWKWKHESAVKSMKASEQKLVATITGLEQSMREAESKHTEHLAALEQKSRSMDALEDSHQAGNAEHGEALDAMRREVDEHKSIAAASTARLAELEQSHANILQQVEEDARARELTEKELETHRKLVFNLQSQLEEHKSAVTFHQQALDTLRDSHSKELEQVNAQTLAAHTESNEKLTKAMEEHKTAAAALHEELSKTHTQHQENTDALHAELTKTRTEMVGILKAASVALDRDTDASTLHSHLRSIADERKDLLARHKDASDELRGAQEELKTQEGIISGLESKVGELKMINDETLKELEKISEKEKKSARLVDELEEQLNANYDQHQATNNRLSALQTQRNSQLADVLHAKTDVERELEESRSRIAQLEGMLGGKRNSQRESLTPEDANLQRSNSNNSNLRKSTSHNSLPSPPPAIPLPPLPGSPPGNSANAVSPPASRHQSKDIAQAQLVEDQEARIRTIEKHLYAEKQLTATLEEALTDLEATNNKTKSEADALRKQCEKLAEEVEQMRVERHNARYSLQAVEEERNARMRVEAERANLEARMNALNASNKSKSKKKSTLNCF